MIITKVFVGSLSCNNQALSH